MPLVFLVVAIVAALFLPRVPALALALAAWMFSAAMVAWGPAGDETAHPDRFSFWFPGLIVLAVGLAVAFGLRWFKDRRAGTPATDT
jgi:hypothetical protein